MKGLIKRPGLGEEEKNQKQNKTKKPKTNPTILGKKKKKGKPPQQHTWGARRGGNLNTLITMILQ